MALLVTLLLIVLIFGVGGLLKFAWWVLVLAAALVLAGWIAGNGRRW